MKTILGILALIFIIVISYFAFYGIAILFDFNIDLFSLQSLKQFAQVILIICGIFVSGIIFATGIFFVFGNFLKKMKV